MKFKIDENLPIEYRSILERAGFQAETVGDENLSGTDDGVVIARCRNESRILLTLDLDFGNTRPTHRRRFPASSFSVPSPKTNQR